MTVPRLRCEIAHGASPFDSLINRLDLTGAVGDYASTPDHNDLDVTGRIVIMAAIAPRAWQSGTWRTIVNKANWAAGNNISFSLYLSGSAPVDRLRFIWSPDGTTANSLDLSSTALPPGIGGQPLVVAVDFLPNNGSGGKTAFFYTAPFDSTKALFDHDLTQLGGPVTESGTTSIFSGNANLRVGDDTLAGDEFDGHIYSVLVMDNGWEGTLVANPDFSTQSPGTTSFDDSTGKTWSMQGNAHIAGIAWTDHTARIRGTHELRLCSRQHELGRFESGTSSGAFDNRDRGLDPVDLGGPMRPRLPIRYVAEWEGQDYPLYTGYIEESPLRYSRGVDAFVEVKAADALKQFVRYKPRSSPYSRRVLGANPSLYWRLDEQRGRTAVDLSGNERHGAMNAGVITGVEGPLPSEGGSAVLMSPSARINGGNVFNFERTDPFSVAALLAIDSFQGATPVAGRRLGNRGWNLSIVDGQAVFILANQHENHIDVRSGVWIADGEWHLVVVIYNGNSAASGVTWVIDGCDGGKQIFTDSLSATTQAAVNFIAGPGALVVPSPSPLRLAELAVFEGALAPDFAAALDDEARHPWRSHRAGDRVSHLLDWHPIDRRIDRGVATLGAITSPAETLEDMHRAADSEVGTVYVTPEGRIAFDDRYASIFESTSVVTFGEEGGTLAYSELDPSFDDVNLWTEVEVTREGGQARIIVADVGAKDIYGDLQLAYEGQWADDNQAQAIGERLLARYSHPRIRFPSISAVRSSEVWGSLLGLRINDRVTVRKQPKDSAAQPLGAVISQECWIAGVTWTVNRDHKRWELTLDLVPAEESRDDLFRVGVDALGSSKVLAW